MKFRFDHAKNTKLSTERGISFDEIIDTIIENGVLAAESHYNSKKYPNQNIFYVQVKNEVYSVPFVIEDDGTIFLKTIFANRKARKRFLKNKKPRP
jgi:uncharacterized DUF497 family protein